MACSECGCGGSMHAAWCTHANAVKFKEEAHNLKQENKQLRRELKRQGLSPTGRRQDYVPKAQNIPPPKYNRARFVIKRQDEAMIVAMMLVSSSRSFSLMPLPNDEWEFDVRNEDMLRLINKVSAITGTEVTFQKHEG